ncbi:MAG TPA: tyrosine-type recombinase/integrase, partial [Acidimicrobiales bacterium]|nr:tyrosine-type recombinase/integrase [Acidimicrobiales bacterium]
QPELRVLETAPTAKARALDLIAEYGAHLERSPLSPATRRSYERQTHAYLTWLSGRGDRAEVALSEQLERDFAVRDYRSELKDRRLSPASLNAALAALDHFYRFRGLGPPAVRREHLEAQAPRALNEQELRAVLRAGERRGKARDRAAIALMALAGLRIAEVAGLDVDDVALSARKGHVLVRRGKGDASRTVPLGADARTLLGAWVAERPEIPTRAMFVTSSGGRLSTRSLDRVVRATGDLAGVSLSAHVLRHTFVTRLVRAGVDVVLVAELAGHRSLETTRRYSLPSEADRQAAVELASVDA